MDKLPPDLAALISLAIQDGIAKGLTSAQAQQQAAAATEPTGQTIVDLWPAWEEWASVNIDSWKVCKTHKAELLKFFGACPWSEVTPAKADDYYTAQRRRILPRTKKPPSPTYVHRQLTTLCSMLAWHVHRETIKYNPISGFRRIDEEPYARQTFLSESQFAEFIGHMSPLGQDIAQVSYNCVGMRNTEARELMKDEVKLDAMVIQLGARRTKARRGRVIPFDEATAAILRRNMEVSRGLYVFVNPRDPKRLKPLSERTLQNWIEAAREASGIVGFNGAPVCFHVFRHSSATQFIQDNAPETFVKAAGGFSHRTIQRYSKFQTSQHETLRNILRNRVAPKRSDSVGEPARETAKRISVKPRSAK